MNFNRFINALSRFFKKSDEDMERLKTELKAMEEQRKKNNELVDKSFQEWKKKKKLEE